MEMEEELHELWILFTDGSSCTDGSGAGPILTNPEGMEFTYALRFRFGATNNEAEYEAMIVGLRIAEQMEEKREQAAIHEAKSNAKMEKYYNSKVRSASFKPGDLVYRNNDASRAEDTGKLGPRWEGQYEVMEALGKDAYKLRDRDGKQLPWT
nr:reverse transcriptase domain-containing protein [Tanacetum cinerariifolium]